LLLASLALTGCQKDAGSSPESGESSESASQDEAAEDGDWESNGFSVGKLKIIAASNIYSNPEATKPEELTKQLTAALEATPSYNEDAAPLYGSITYDARTTSAASAERSRDVVLFGDLRRKGDDDPTAKYTSEVLVRSEPGSDETYADVTKEAVKQFAERIDATIRIRGASAKGLTAILKSADETEKAKVTAIQQIRERQIDGTEPVLRDILAAKKGESDALRVAAAAALVELGDAESRPKILELAPTDSRDKNANLLPMIYILGDMGGQDVVTYLSTVADAHSSPQVRQVAKEAVDKAVESTALKAPK
jgi:hypothetical protein